MTTTPTTTATALRTTTATLVGELLWKRSQDAAYVRSAVEYVRVLRRNGAPAWLVARALQTVHVAIRWVREDNAQLADVTLCDCGSLRDCGCVVPF